MIEYVELSWTFDSQRFGADLREWKRDNQLTWGEMAELSGHYESDGALSALGRGAFTPTLDGYLALCVLCDLNPYQYIVLADR